LLILELGHPVFARLILYIIWESHPSSRASDLAALEYAAGLGAIASWRTIAIARDGHQIWPGWLGWNAPTLTQRVAR
jgi:hypothetical protein